MDLQFQASEILNYINSEHFNVLQESVVHCLQIKGTQINITQTWQLESPVTTVMCSPDYETLLLSSNTVSTQIYYSVAYCT